MSRSLCEHLHRLQGPLRRQAAVSGKHLKSFGQQPVPGQKRNRFPKSDVAGGFAAAHIVVVHARQIIVNQRVCMHHFQSTGKRQSWLLICAESAAKLQCQRCPQAFSTAQQAVSHCFGDTVSLLLRQIQIKRLLGQRRALL